MLVGKEVLSFSPICRVETEVCIRYEYVIKDEKRPFLFHFDRNYFDANMFYVYKIVVWLGSEDYILYEFLIFVFVKFIYSDKATNFFQNLHRRFDWHYIGQMYGGDFAKFCALLRIYEIYIGKYLIFCESK